MGLQWDKQPASRVIRSQTLTWTSTTSTVVSTSVTSETFQVRLIASLGGNVAIGDIGTLTTTTTILSSAGLTTGINNAVSVPGVFSIPVSVAGGEYFTITPGQVIAFSSTSTATGTLNIAEMS